MVQGCQEDPSMMRMDSPTGSRDSFSWSFLAQHRKHWSCSSADAASAYLQAGGIGTVALAHNAKAAAITKM